MDNSKLNSIKDTEVLSDEIMNEIEGATCTRCTYSCAKSKSQNGDDNTQEGYGKLKLEN